MSRNTVAVVFGCALAFSLYLLLEFAFGLVAPSALIWHVQVLPDSERAGDRKLEVATSFRQRKVISSKSYRSPYLRDVAVYPPGYFSNQTANWALRASTGKFRVYKKNGVSGKMIYDVNYEIDERGYRPVPEVATRPRRHAVFIGCSCTFGEGVEATETIPYFFENENRDFRSYDLGFHGYGPNDLLARAMVEETGDFVHEKNGLIIYTIIDDHIRRVVGSTSWLGPLHGRNPYFYLQDGELRQDRNFAAARPLLVLFAAWLNASPIARYFSMDFPKYFGDRHFDLYGAVVTRLRDVYRQKFPQSRFYAVLYPGVRLGPKIAAQFEKSGIRYLDYSHVNLGLYTNGPPQILGDRHPTAEANQVIADQIGLDIAEFEKKNPPLNVADAQSESK